MATVRDAGISTGNAGNRTVAEAVVVVEMRMVRRSRDARVIAAAAAAAAVYRRLAGQSLGESGE